MDAKYYVLPASLMFIGFLLAIIRIAVFGPSNTFYSEFFSLHGWLISVFELCFGALVVSAPVWGMGKLWGKLRGVEALGFGDVIMLAMIGAYLGWRRTLLAFFLSLIFGSLGGLAIALKRKENLAGSKVPYGSFIGFGAIISLCFGDEILSWY
ncbi:MAG: prepilin peptidase, partial [Pyrinomonadaceae bacterium]